MRLFGQRFELGLRNGFVDYVELDGETKATRGARADGDGAGNCAPFAFVFFWLAT